MRYLIYNRLFQLDRAPDVQALRNIDQALIFRPAKAHVQRFQLDFKRAVDQHVRASEQLALRVGSIQQVFKQVSRVRSHLQTQGMRVARNFRA